MSLQHSTTFAGVCLLSLTTGCATIGWDGEVHSFGSVREALRDGDTHGRVRLVDAARGADTVGVGALAGLAGEITIADGVTWITRANADGTLSTTRGMATGDEATLLFTAHVSEWAELSVDSELPLASLPAWAGFPASEWATIPFVVHGRFVQLEAHVVNGACARKEPVPAGKEPVRRRAAQGFGTLVGFWARDGAGAITHVGENVHAHVLVNGEPAYTAHIDRVRIAPGSTVLVPRKRERVNKQFSLGRAYD